MRILENTLALQGVAYTKIEQNRIRQTWLYQTVMDSLLVL